MEEENKYILGECDLSYVQIMRENEEVVDSMYLLGSKASAMNTVYNTYKGSVLLADVYQAKHVCVLLNKDLFEYSPEGWCRRKDIGRFSKYNWAVLGHVLNGTTKVSPDELENIIRNNGNWTKNKYNFFFHNCHDFAQFVMRALGCPEEMIVKKGPCSRDQRKRLK